MVALASSAPGVLDDYAVSVGRIKGAAFREFLLCFEMRHGSDHLSRALASISPSFRAPLDVDAPAFGVEPAAWYPATLVHGLLDGLLAGRSPEERSAIARESGELVTEQTLRGAYRPLFDLITPERYARHAQRIWRAWFETGFSTISRVSPTCHEQRVAAWAEHHPFICEMNAAAAAVLYRAMGVSRPRAVRTGCVSDGWVACTSRVTWDP